MSFVSLVALLVDDYDDAISFYCDVLGFELVEDSPSTTNDGRPKRWVVVRPPGGETGILLALGDGEEQTGLVGRQHGGRVGFFLRVDDFDSTLVALTDAGATIHGEPRDESYGRVVVFEDLYGNKWDLLGSAEDDRVYPPGVFVDYETGGPLQLELARIGPGEFRLLREFAYRDQNYSEPFICPHDLADFDSDLASIPFFFSWILPARGTHFPAIMLHDCLVAPPGRPEHRGPDVDREEADRIMRDAMERLGVGFVRRWLAWTGAFLATAFVRLQPRWCWATLVVFHFALVTVLGVIATLDLFDVWNVLPWMGERGTVAELGLGALFAVIIPIVLSVLWLGRWRAPAIGGVLLALVLHITLGILAVYGLYRAAERLFAPRTRTPEDVAADARLLSG